MSKVNFRHILANVALLLFTASCSNISPSAYKRTPPMNLKFLNCNQDSSMDGCDTGQAIIDKTKKSLSKYKDENINIFDNFFTNNKAASASTSGSKKKSDAATHTESVAAETGTQAPNKTPKKLGIENESDIEHELNSSTHSKLSDNFKSHTAQPKPTVPASGNVPAVTPVVPAPTRNAPVVVPPAMPAASGNAPVVVPPAMPAASSNAPVVVPPAMPAASGNAPVVTSVVPVPIGNAPAMPAASSNAPVVTPVVPAVTGNVPAITSPVPNSLAPIQPVTNTLTNQNQNSQPPVVNQDDNAPTLAAPIPIIPSAPSAPSASIGSSPSSKSLPKVDMPSTSSNSQTGASATKAPEMKSSPVPADKNTQNVPVDSQPQAAANAGSNGSLASTSSKGDFVIPSQNFVRPKDIATGAVAFFYEESPDDEEAVNSNPPKNKKASASKKMQLVSAAKDNQRPVILTEENTQQNNQKGWKGQLKNAKTKVIDYFSVLKDKVENLIQKK